jgi:hypothetical protein
MSFREFDERKPVSDLSIIWRYQDLSGFLVLLLSKALFFSPLDKLDDKWEGKCASDQFIQQAFGIAGDPQAVANARQILDKTMGFWRVNCWHRNKFESIAMWKLYTHGKDGVAIQSTVQRLKDSIELPPQRKFVIGAVQYTGRVSNTTSATDPQEPSAGPLFTKRTSFAHEEEIRLAVAKDPRKPVLDDRPEEQISQLVTVDLKILIERIVVSPYYPDWAIPTLKKIIEDAGLTVTVGTSDLLLLPGETAK